MKKNIITSSFLMLALGLGYSACSENEIDNYVIETQSNKRVITLRADINSAYTRCAIEETSDGDDTFRITGWNDGDKVYGIYADGGYWGTVEFIYSIETQEFSAETEVGLSEIQYIFCGGDLEIGYTFVSSPGRAVQIYPKFDLGIDLANNSMDNIFLFGAASVENEKLTASLSPKMAIACVHNDTDEAINITGYRTSEEYGDKYLERMYYNTGFGSLGDNLSYWGGGNSLAEELTNVTVPAHGKKYVSIPCMLTASDSNYSYGLVKVDGSVATIIAPARNDLEIGKIYKVNSSGTTGRAKTIIGANYIDVKWVQLWENGPKWADYNVGVTDGKAESKGGYWSGSENPTTQWGSNWRMPTKSEFEALINAENCESTYITVNGNRCLKITGKGAYSSNSVLFPAGGYIDYGQTSASKDNEFGRYWTISPASGSNLWCMGYGDDDSAPFVSEGGSYFQHSVRAVLAE